MTQPLTASLRGVVLLVGLEPSAPRIRVEAALVLVGHRASELDDALDRGLVVLIGERLEVCDGRLLREVLASVHEHQRRTAHLALACARVGSSDGHTRRAFDAVCAARETPSEAPAVVRRFMAEGLTPQERRVADLAATGAPVCEIALTVFLSQKTVEHYLT